MVVHLEMEVELTWHFRRNLPSYRRFFVEVRKYGSPHLLKAYNQNKHKNVNLSYPNPQMHMMMTTAKQSKRKKLTIVQQCPCIWLYISISNSPILLLSQVSHPRPAIIKVCLLAMVLASETLNRYIYIYISTRLHRFEGGKMQW